MTNFKPITFIDKAQLLQDGGYNYMLQRYGVFIEFLMFGGNKLSYIVLVLMNLCEPERNAIPI